MLSTQFDTLNIFCNLLYHTTKIKSMYFVFFFYRFTNLAAINRIDVDEEKISLNKMKDKF